MFDRLVRVQRKNEYGMTTLSLRGPDSEIELRIVSRASRRERRNFVRTFLIQIRPWLERFRDPEISHSGRGPVPGRRVGRDTINLFQSASMATLSGSAGYVIRKKRIELGLTQTELAQGIGIHRSHLSDIERGIHLPHPKTRLALEKALEITLG